MYNIVCVLPVYTIQTYVNGYAYLDAKNMLTAEAVN